jgi:hypothetical protein
MLKKPLLRIIPFIQRVLLMGNNYKTLFILGLFPILLLSAVVNAYATGTQPSSQSLQQGISVLQFGAKGDGITDDSSAINAAIRYASNVGSFVYFPQKASITTYLIKSPIYMLSNVSLKGVNKNSVIIKCDKDNVYSIYFATNVSNCEISNLTIDGANANNSYGILIAYNGNNNINIDNDAIQNFKGNSVGMRVIGNSNNITIADVTVNNIGDRTITNTGYYGIGIYIGMEISNVTVEDCEISNTWGSSAILINPPDKNINIINNNIHDTFQRGIEGYYVTPGVINVNVKIENNTITNAGILNNTGSNVGSNGIYATNGPTATLEYSIIGNNIQNVGENGIECWFGGIIQGNTISHTGAFQGIGTGSTEGIYIVSNCSVMDNKIEHTASEGILMGSFSTNVYKVRNTITISNNTISNVGLVQHPFGIHIQASGSGCSISNVNVTGNNIANGTNPITGISATADSDGTLSNIAITNNVIGSGIKNPYIVPHEIRSF